MKPKVNENRWTGGDEWETLAYLRVDEENVGLKEATITWTLLWGWPTPSGFDGKHTG